MSDDLPPITAKSLALERYDGTTDPDDHVDAFLTQINLFATNDATLCRVFPITLKGAALSWFRGLPECSIDSFDTLIERFNAQYATSRAHQVTSAALANLRQAENETLRDFMTRFGKMASQIRNLNPEVALHSILLALRPGKFADSLCRKPLAIWTNCVNVPKVIYGWRRCPPSVTKSDSWLSLTRRPMIRTQSLTNRTNAISRTSVNCFKKAQSTRDTPL